MRNMDEKGLTLDTANRSKVITCTGRRPPKTTHDGTRELITIIETCGAKRVMLEVYGVSESGVMAAKREERTEIFLWVEKVVMVT